MWLLSTFFFSYHFIKHIRFHVFISYYKFPTVTSDKSSIIHFLLLSVLYTFWLMVFLNWFLVLIIELSIINDIFWYLRYKIRGNSELLHYLTPFSVPHPIFMTFINFYLVREYKNIYSSIHPKFVLFYFSKFIIICKSSCCILSFFYCGYKFIPWFLRKSYKVVLMGTTFLSFFRISAIYFSLYFQFFVQTRALCIENGMLLITIPGQWVSTQLYLKLIRMYRIPPDSQCVILIYTLQYYLFS